MRFGNWIAQTGMLLLLATPAWTQAPETWVLRFEDLPRLLSERNQNVKSAILSEEAASARTGYFARSFLPRLLIEGGAENFETGIYRRLTQPYGLLEAKVNLFQGGRDYLEEQIREGEYLSARSQSRKLQNQELLEVRQAYWTLVYQSEEIEIHKKAVEQNEKYLAAANRRIQRGLTTETDRLDFQINRDVLKEELESLEHEVLLTEIKLQSLLSTAEGQKFKGADQIPHDHDEQIMSFGLDSASNADVMELQAAEQIARSRSASTHRWWMPSLDVYAGYYLYTLRDRDYVDQALRNDTVAGFRLTLHLFDGFESIRQASASGKQAEAQEGKAYQETRKAHAKLRLVQEEMKHQHELIHTAEGRIELGQSYLSRTLGDYDRGVKNSVDVLGALQRLIQFKSRYAELRRDYQQSKAELLGMLGK
jgi:outer membrane protein